MRQQFLLRITLPIGCRVYPSKFRELLAKIPNLPNELFHRDQDGETVNSRPDLRVVGAGTWVGLLANPGHEQLISDAIGPVIIAINAHVGQPCKVEIERPDYGLRESDAPVSYLIREMAIKRRTPAALAMSVEDLIVQRTLRSIEAACASEDIDCPMPSDLGIQTIEAIRPRGLQLLTTQGLTNEYVTLVDAKIMMHAKLHGHWFAGNLTSRGYGRIVSWHTGRNVSNVSNDARNMLR